MKNKLLLTFVNALTFTRIIGTFIMPIIASFASSKALILFIAFILLTDTFDGLLARRFEVSTLFGAILDAFADKLFGIATIFVIARNYPVMYLPIVVEIIIMIINTDGATRGSKIESSYLGKFKTWVFGICTIVSFLVIFANDFILIFENSTGYGASLYNVFMYLIDNDISIVNYLAFVMVGADIMVTFDYTNRVKEDTKKAREDGMRRGNYRLKKGDALYFALFDHEYYIKTKNEPFLIRLGEEVGK